MSKRAKIISLGISFSLLFSVAAYASTNENLNTFFDSLKGKYGQKTDKEIQKDLKSLSKKDLMKEIKEVAKKDVTALISYGDALMQRKDEFENPEIISILSDSTSSENEKILMVDLYTNKNMDKVDNSDIKKLLKEKSVDSSTKSKIISDIKFDKNDKNLLEDLIKENDGVVFFHSLKKLSTIDDSEAYEISKNILSNYNSESKHKVSAALNATTKYLKNNKTKNKDIIDTEESFINLGLEIINTTTDADLKDAAVFSLSELKSKNSISKIIKNTSVYKVLKSYSIDENFMQLKEMLLNNPTELDVETVVDAMEILPIMDLADDLEKSLKGIDNNDLQNRGKKILETMRTSGINADKKSIAN